MSNEFKVNLDDYSEKELQAAVAAKRKIDVFKKKPPWEQFLIIAKQNGMSVTAIVILLSGGVWQKENIKRFLNPPADVINEQIVFHNLPADVETNTRKIEALTSELRTLESSLDDLAYLIKKNGYCRRK